MKRDKKKDRHPIVEAICEAIAQPVGKEDRAKYKKLAFERKHFGRIDAIAMEILPTLSKDELKRLSSHIRKAARTAPKRPPRTAKDIEQEAQYAHDLHAALTKPPFDFTVTEADELIGRGWFKGGRTAYNRRTKHSETVEKKTKK